MNIGQVQTEAPAFTSMAVMPDLEIRSVSLSDYRGKWVVFLFYQLSFAFVCPTEVIAFNDRVKDFDKIGCQIIAASCDSPYANLAFCKTPREEGGIGGHVDFPIVSDFSKSIAISYGVLLGDGTPSPATFIISPTGIIRQVCINDTSIGRNVDETIRLIQALQYTDLHGEVCPANWQPGSKTIVANPEGSKVYFKDVVTTTALHNNNSSSSSSNNSNQRASSGVITSPPSSYASFSSGIMSIFVHYQQLLKKYPLQTKAATSCIISILGEVLGTYLKLKAKRQNQNGKSNLDATSGSFLEKLDFKRMAIFASYGLVVTGPIFHWWYGFLESFVGKQKLSPNVSILMKLALNQLVLTPPFLALTLAYLQYAQTLNGTKTFQKIQNTYAAALFTNWKVWTVAQAVNFTAVPLDYRVLFGNMVALWWNIYLSMVN